jgi:hydrogenase nickel incorporation protein HypA/HybF
MHELSIALRVIDLAEGHLRAAGGGRVAAVRLRVGRLAGVVPEALRTALGIAAQGTPLEAAAVEIEEVPVRIWCPACQREVTLPGLVPLACPECGARSGDVRAGHELELASLVLAAEVEYAA